jgi:hypothetical protein
MSQADINAFVHCAGGGGSLTPEGVTTAVGTRNIPVNGRRSGDGWTALHYAVYRKRCELVVPLLAAGADPNVKDAGDSTSVRTGAAWSTEDILQLLIDGGGSVNEPDIYGQTPLITLVSYDIGAVAVRLQVLLACPELDLDAKYDGMTAEERAVNDGHSQLAAPIAQERARRKRWSAVRTTWITVTIALAATSTK